MEATERPYNLVRLVGGGLGGQNYVAPWPLRQEVLIFDDWYDLDVVAIYNVHYPIYVKRGFQWSNDDQSIADEAWDHLCAPTILTTSAG